MLSGVASVAKTRGLLESRIIQDPAIMVGKPVIKGTRVPVESVLLHLADNLDLDDLFEAYPHITRDDVQACLDFASRSLPGPTRKNVPRQRDSDA
jgi:uncharacterized protein (DUF433 family)